LHALIRLLEANKQESGDSMDINVGLRRAILVGLLGVAAYGSGANAAYLQVCSTCAHTTVQSAVNAAVSGDSVFVAAGRYLENVTIAGKDLAIFGADDGSAATTIIIGTGRGPVFTLGDAAVGGVTYTIALYNLTITGGQHTNASGEGGGIQVRRGATLALSDSIVAHNVATYGAGISFNNPDALDNSIRNSTVEYNSAIGPGTAVVAAGGGIAVLSGGVDIAGLTAVNNDAVKGGGIYSAAGTRLSLDRSTISANSVHEIQIKDKSWVGGQGGGLFVASAYSISNDVITSNGSDALTGGGGGLFLDAGTSVDVGGGIHDCLVALNSNGWGTGGGISISGGVGKTVALTKDYIVHNVGTGISNTSTLVLADTIIRDNSGQNCVGGAGCPN
jgi:hypothetical protein